jgi:hypothetical protein
MVRGSARAQPDWRRVSFPARIGVHGSARGQPDWGHVSFPALLWLTWGAVTGTTAGELLRVEYTLSRPELVSAELVLADGRRLTMIVAADHLEVLLPPDTPDGPATVVAQLDDGARTATAELIVFLTGVPLVPPQRVPDAAPLRRGAHRLVRADPVRVRVRAEPGRLERRAPPTTVRVLGLPARVRHAPVVRVLARSPAGVRLTAGPTVVRAAVRAAGATAALRVGETAVAHRDGRALEEALLLDLL